MAGADAAAWEALWAPYDDDTYEQVLAHVPPAAVVLDIGAGDLRLARQLAGRARQVVALEIRAELLPQADVPANVRPICGDARTAAFPPGIDTAVLLMRHCTSFGLYRDKLVAAGCERLITNARWGAGVECIDLTRPPRAYGDLEMGWYGCRCGAAGFRSGPAERLDAAMMQTVHEVESCPECDPRWSD